MIKTFIYLSVAFTLLVIPCLAVSAEFQGKVVSIIDGDTISVLRDGQQVRVRLTAIAAPEKGQPYGKKAKRHVKDLVTGKSVTVKYESLDRYGRILGAVILPEGTSLNHELVAKGLAWWYREYAPNDVTIIRLELEARRAKLGIWAEPNPIPPWEWRQGKRGQQSVQLEASTAYHGNLKSHVFHRPGCRWYNCKNCTAVFKDRQTAIGAGYRSCKVCKP